MTKEEIIDFVKSNNHCFLATLEGDQPRVRGVHLYVDDTGEFIVHTGKVKDLYHQLQTSRKVEICCVDFQKMIQVRVAGNPLQDEDLALKEKIVEDRPYLKPFVEQGSIDGLAVFRIQNPQAVVWSMKSNLAPKETILLSIA